MKNQNQKGSTLIGIIAVIIVAIICGGGFLAWKYYSELEEEEGVETLEIEIETPEIETPKDETAGWKTYRNEEHGFSFKYPPQFNIEDNLQLLGNFGLPKNYLKIENNLIIENPSLILYVNPEGFGPFFPDISYDIQRDGDKIEIVDTEVIPPDENNSDGKKFIMSKTAKLGTHSYWFMYSFNEGGKDLVSVFDQILSTFKFIGPEKKEEIADWELYRNEEYGFEIKYPDYYLFEENENIGFSKIVVSFRMPASPGSTLSIEVLTEETLKDYQKTISEQQIKNPYTLPCNFSLIKSLLETKPISYNCSQECDDCSNTKECDKKECEIVSFKGKKSLRILEDFTIPENYSSTNRYYISFHKNNWLIIKERNIGKEEIYEMISVFKFID